MNDIVFITSKDTLVMARNFLLHVGSATIAKFDGIFVKYFVVPMMCRKMLADQSEEGASNVCLYLYIIRGIEPDNVSLPLAWRGCGGGIVIVFDVITKSTCLKAVVINVLCFVKLGLITG